jgi:hypothetical protein
VQSALAAEIEVISLEPNGPLYTRADHKFDKQNSISVEAALVNVFHAPVPDSIYLADELFEIVANAEDGNQIDKGNAIVRLQYLRSLYASDGASQLAKKAIKLIDQAQRLVSQSDTSQY